MLRCVVNFLKGENGATAIEYGMICAFMVIVLILSIRALGTNVQGLFQQVVDGFS